MSSWNFMLNWDEHENSFITSGLDNYFKKVAEELELQKNLAKVKDSPRLER